jgi:toxin-antitoxin system PIN domain toxin
MIVPDINLLLYAYDSGSPFHKQAAEWWEECLSGSEPVGLPQVVIFGFLRIVTHSRVFTNPLTADEAARHIRSWLAQPFVEVLHGTVVHVQAVLESVERIGTAGNLVTDAQIAALAAEHNAIVHTADSDFLRFPGVRWHNPITGASSSGVKNHRL